MKKISRGAMTKDEFFTRIFLLGFVDETIRGQKKNRIFRRYANDFHIYYDSKDSSFPKNPDALSGYINGARVMVFRELTARDYNDAYEQILDELEK